RRPDPPRLRRSRAQGLRGPRRAVTTNRDRGSRASPPGPRDGRSGAPPTLTSSGVDSADDVIDDPRATLDDEVLDLASRLFDWARSGDAAMLAAFLAA